MQPPSRSALPTMVGSALSTFPSWAGDVIVTVFSAAAGPLAVGQQDEWVLADGVGARAEGRLQHDEVALLQLVDVGERLAVRRPVAGNGDVPLLTGQGCPRIVARPCLQRAGRRSLDD